MTHSVAKIALTGLLSRKFEEGNSGRAGANVLVVPETSKKDTSVSVTKFGLRCEITARRGLDYNLRDAACLGCE